MVLQALAHIQVHTAWLHNLAPQHNAATCILARHTLLVTRVLVRIIRQALVNLALHSIARRREKTPPEIRAAREAEKELRAMERSTRTVFAYNLSLKADERQVFEFFSQAGTVNDVKIITDKNTRR